MKVRFTKMHGAGNDFCVLDCTEQPFCLSVEQLRRLADRRFGVGADQILVVEKPKDPQNDFRYRIFNQDGGEVEQCGNGARCFVRFVHDKGLTEKRKIRVETMRCVIEPELLDKGLVKVNMGVPSFRPEDLPFNPKGLPEREVAFGVKQYAIEFGRQLWWFSPSSMGNPHVTLLVEDIDSAPVATLGAHIERHPAFPKKVNVGFVQPLNSRQGKIRVWERGAGETLACGTGNCAAATTSMQLGVFEPSVELINRGGRLQIDWEGEGMSVEMTGPAATVFESEIEL